MSYERVIYGADPESVAARERAVNRPLAEPPKSKWITELIERQAAGEILMPAQIDLLRRVGRSA
jgi:hypothetical protein